MNSLYIIGNGFDLYHKMDTSYQSFAEFLEVNNYESFLNFEKYFSADYEFWSKFEENLAKFDYENVIEDNSHLIQSYGAEDWSDSGHHDFQFELNNIVCSLTEDMIFCFKKWLQAIKTPNQLEISETTIRWNKNSKFMNFNGNPPRSNWGF